MNNRKTVDLLIALMAMAVSLSFVGKSFAGETERISISGFFDIELNKLDTSDSTMGHLIRDELTFSNSHLNLYLDSQVASKVRFFGEIRMLNQPSTLFTEENLADRYQGSLLIERAWADWNLRNATQRSSR